MYTRVEKTKYLDTLRMSDARLVAMVDHLLDQSDSRRRATRHPTNFMRMTAEVAQPGGTIGRYIVRSVDLSETGVGFLNGNYLHPSSRCRLSVKTTDGELLGIDGCIVHCTNLRGHVHLVGVQFDSPIDLTWFEESNKQGAPPIDREAVAAALAELGKLVKQDSPPAAFRPWYDRLGVLLQLAEPNNK